MLVRESYTNKTDTLSHTFFLRSYSDIDKFKTYQKYFIF